MAYLVKETIASTPRPYVLDGIISDHRQQLLKGDALVRDERQDFWYSVAELIGEAPTPLLRFVCQHCKGMIQGRKIDTGLEVKCPKCGHPREVPDVAVLRNAVLDTQTLRQANGSLLGGFLFFAIGAGATAASYMDAISRKGGSQYSIFWGLAILGAGMMITGFSQRRRHFKVHPPPTQRQPKVKHP